MRKRWPYCLAVILVSFAVSGWAQKPSNSKSRTIPGVASSPESNSNHPVKGPDDKDQVFIKDAAISDAAEIGLGQMAQQNAANPKVKAFGQRMVEDHSRNDDLLKGIAQQQHVALPTELDAKHKAEKERLSKQTGAQFDNSYTRLMVQAHKQAIQKFTHEMETTRDATVKDFAKSALPVLQSHLKEAESIQSELKANK